MSAKFPHSSCSVNGTTLKASPYRGQRFLLAYAEAIYAIKTNREQTMKIFAKRMRVEDPETVKSTYEYFAPRFSFPPRVNLEGVRDTLQFYAEQNPDFKNRKPEEF